MQFSLEFSNIQGDTTRFEEREENEDKRRERKKNKAELGILGVYLVRTLFFFFFLKKTLIWAYLKRGCNKYPLHFSIKFVKILVL